LAHKFSHTRNPLHLLFKKRQKFTVLVILCTILMTLSAILWHPSFHSAIAAGATITLTPTKGHYTNHDDQIPISVHGTGFTAHESALVYWNYTGPGTGTLVATATASGMGIFTVSFPYQLSPTGIYTVAAIGQTSGAVATAPFTLLPWVYVRPQASGPKSAITFYGYAYGAGETVNLYWHFTPKKPGLLLGTAVGDATGSFNTTVTIPNRAPGAYIVGAKGQTTQATDSYQFNIYTPTLMLAPLSGSALSTVTLSAYGFTGSEAVSIYWNGGSTPLQTAITNSYGYMAPTIINIPLGTAPGSYPVTVVGQTSQITASNTFTVVSPSSRLSLTQGPVGATVRAVLQGYAPNETVNIYWNTANQIGKSTVDSSGNVRANVTIPVATAGSYPISFVGQTSQISTQNTFTLNNSLIAYPSTNSPGLNVTVNGTGYQVGETVQLYWDSTSNSPLATTTVDTQGNIQQTVTFPGNATPQAHNIIGVGQTSGLSFTAPVTVNTNWADFGFGLAHHRENTSENILGTSNVANLVLKWTAPTASGLRDSPVYANGIVYIATMDGHLNAYDAGSGVMIWQFNCQCIFRNYSSPVVDSTNGLVFFGTVGYSDQGIPSPFYALDAQTGMLKWSVILPWHTVSFPTLAFNTLYFGIFTADHGNCGLVALDEFSGQLLWEYVTYPGVWGAVAADNNTHVVFTGLGNPGAAVVALNAQTGNVIWKHSIPEYGTDDDVGSGITVSNGLVYADSKNGSEYALNEQTGAIVWSALVGKQSNGNISSQAVSANGNLYVGSLSNDLYALNATTGSLVWKTPTNSHIYSSPAIANGVVYVASFDENIYALDANTGVVLWKYKLGGQSFSSPIVVNGWLYCGATDGKLYAFNLV
jgi:outer membrane protein assembly factor BamB